MYRYRHSEVRKRDLQLYVCMYICPIKLKKKKKSSRLFYIYILFIFFANNSNSTFQKINLIYRSANCISHKLARLCYCEEETDFSRFD